MELVELGVRPSSMMSPRQVRGPVLAVLLCSALAGCGSVAASQAAAPATSATGSATAATGSATAATGSATLAAPAVGCASVNQATSVTVRRIMHLVEPTRMGALSLTQRKTALVRALFGQFCNAVAHADTQKGTVACPADFGISYSGTFYDGRRALATFVYGASGCQTVSLTAGGKTRSTMVAGTASAAAPHLRADMAAVLGVPASMLAPPQSQVNPGGPNKPLRQVARLVEVELAVLDPQDERLPLRLGEVELVAVGVRRVVHHVQPGLIGLVRRGRGVGGDVDLDPALLSVGRRCVVTRCVHALRLLP
jgi:hypothetical protein